MPDLDVILNRLRAAVHHETPDGGDVSLADAESAVREARDTTVQEIVEWLEDPEVAATTFYSTRDVAFSLARRFPNGGTNASS